MKLDEMMNDPFYLKIVGKCAICNRDTPRGESHDCNTCEKMYCMNCVIYNVDGITATVLCPLNHFIANGVDYEDESDLEKLK